MTVATLRPYIVTGDWAGVGGGDLADNSDATYRTFDNIYQQGQMIFATGTMGLLPGSVIRAIRVRVRSRTVSGAGSYMQVYAVTGPTGRTLISSGDNSQMVAVGTVFVENSAPWKIITMTQSDGDITVGVFPIAVGDPIRVAEAYLDVDFVNAPYGVLSRPTGTYTTTSAPDIAWTYSSPSLYPQTAYRFMIYTAAQYSAAGFVAGTSSPTYDSGIVYSNKNKTRLPALVNGTYRVYLSTAQTVDNGVLQWSLWSDSWARKDYVLNILPPVAPTISAVADSTNARIRLTITGAGALNSVFDLYEIERSVDAGVTWAVVRGNVVGGYVDNVGGARVWSDYETANGQAAVYRARTITYDTAGNILVGAYSANSASTSWSSTSTWLKIATRPDLNRTGIIRFFGSESYPIDDGTFHGLDSGEAVVISGIRRDKPDSSITFLAQTEAERDALKEMLSLGEPLIVQAGSRASGWKNQTRYLSVHDVVMSRPTRAGWSELRDLACPYTESDPPDVDVYLLDLGTFDWQEVDDTYPTFTLWSASATTYGDLRR